MALSPQYDRLKIDACLQIKAAIFAVNQRNEVLPLLEVASHDFAISQDLEKKQAVCVCVCHSMSASNSFSCNVARPYARVNLIRWPFAALLEEQTSSSINVTWDRV